MNKHGHAGAIDPAPDNGVDRTQILHDLLKLNNSLLAPFSTHLERRHKISLNEFRMLMVIGHLGTTASHELVEETGVTPMSVSRAIATLSKQGRVVVSTDPTNRRRKTLSLSTEGQRLFGLMSPTADGVARYLFEALRPDEVATFHRHVMTLIGALEAQDEAGNSLFLEKTRPPEGAEG